MCGCNKKPGPAYAGRYGFQGAGLHTRTDPTCPTCRVGAFSSSESLPPMRYGQNAVLLGDGRVLSAAQAMLPFPRVMDVRRPIPPDEFELAYFHPSHLGFVRKLR